MPRSGITKANTRIYRSRNTDCPNANSKTIAVLISRFNNAAFSRISECLTKDARDRILVSIAGAGLSLTEMKKSPGRIGKTSFEKLAEKVGFIQSLNLPDFIIRDYSPAWRKEVARTVAKACPLQGVGLWGSAHTYGSYWSWWTFHL